MATPVPASLTEPRASSEITVDRLRTIVQDSHVNFLIGAGTPSTYFGLLGDIEGALTAVGGSGSSREAKDIVRTALQALLADKIISPNAELANGGNSVAETLLESYADFLRTLNRIMLRRRSSLLTKQVNIFTTNFDLAFEIAFEQLGIEYDDGFAGRINPTFDLANYGTLRFRQSVRFEHRSEVPTFNLYKLHGSVGWRVDGATSLSGAPVIRFDGALTGIRRVASKLADAEGVQQIAKPTKIDISTLLEGAASLVQSESSKRFARAFKKLAIVNPDKRKFAITVLNQTYYELLRRFGNELEKENSVLLVHGFSFRDEHLRDLVLRAARSNPTLQIVVFCYSTHDRDEYEALLPANSIKNGNVAYIVPGIINDDEEDLLDLDTVVAQYFLPLVPEPERKPDHLVGLKIEVDGGAVADA